MTRFAVTVAQALFPGVLRSVRDERERVRKLVHRLDEQAARVAVLEAEVEELKAEIDESRRDGRRVAQLYDLVFEHLASRATADDTSDGVTT